MNKHNLINRIRHQWAVIFFATLLSASGMATAGDWPMADAPLFLGTAVPANILFVIDDSGSMDLEVMTKEPDREAMFLAPQPDGKYTGVGPITHRAGCEPLYPTWYGYSYAVQFQSNYISSLGECVTAAETAWRFRNADFNPVYFDPRKQYKPWSGERQNGTAFPDANLNAAPHDPWVTQNGQLEFIDLANETSVFVSGQNRGALAGGMRFYTWTDKNLDGLYDNGEEVGYSIGALTNADLTKNPDWFGATVADVQTNFANWFVYYRSRDLLAKAAFGQVIFGVENMRMGLTTIHPNNVVNTGLEILDATAQGQQNKISLLNNLYRFDPNGNTPVREIYAQVGRYFANRTNSLFDATSVAPLPEAEGGSCQQNFALILTDGSYNGSYSNKNPTIPNADGDGDTSWDGGTYADKYGNTLADIAMYYYEHDIIPDVPNEVPTVPGVDDNNAQHVVTYAISFGIDGTLACSPGDETDAKGNPCPVFPGWPDPSTNNLHKIDDLRHAAYNGRGEFLAASNPDEMVASLKYMLDSILDRTAASAALSFNTTTVRTDTLVFQARYMTKDWTGELHFIPFAQLGQGDITIVNVGNTLKKRVAKSGHTSRHIITSDGGSKAFPFRWGQYGTLDGYIGTESLFNYLRGDQTCELKRDVNLCVDGVLKYRNRTQPLGDIVNSAPYHMGKPAQHYTFDNYGDFVTLKSTRTPVVFVASNDGIVHGFDASINPDGTFTATSGQELIGYVPSFVHERLPKLADPAYSHEYYVDGSPEVGDANFGSSTAPDWRSVLVGGAKSGAQGIYALDVTSPEKFSEANASNIFLWEFTDKHDLDLGYTFSAPVIVRLNDGRWVAVFGNGYNNTAPDGLASGSGNAVLYVVDLKSGALIKKLDTGVGMSADPEGSNRPNGLSQIVAADVDQDNKTDYIYGGDLFGNMWRFDLTDLSDGNWAVSFGGKPLFTAISPEGKMQSITAKPALSLHPSGNGYMVYFGTGKYFEPSDNNMVGVPTQTFYGAWDKWAKGSTDPFVAFDRTALLQQQIIEEVAVGDSGTARVTTDNVADWTVHHGWYMDLMNLQTMDNQGERVVNEPIFRSGRIIFTTLIPSGAVCEFGGTGWLMVLDAYDGSRFALSPFDLNADGSYNSSDLVWSDALGAYVSTTGAMSTHGIPSAPALITSESGTFDMVLMNFSDGSLGGTGSFLVTPPLPPCVDCGDEVITDPETNPDDPIPPPEYNQADSINMNAPFGRIQYQRLK